MVLGRVGLTGATGMLGRHLHAALNAAGADVVSVSRTSGDGVIEWDLSKWLQHKELDELFSGVRAVVHAGALVQPKGEVDQAHLFDVNVRACANLAEWALAKSISLVFISSGSVYADPSADQLNEDSRLGANELGGFYGITKLLAEDVFARYRAQGLNVAVVRPSALFGSGGPREKMLYKFLETAVRGDAISLLPPVEDRVDFVHAADLSDAVIRILKRHCWETFNVASGAPVSIRELAATCVNAAGRGSCDVADGMVTRPPLQRFFLNTNLAQRRLDWHSRITLRQGLAMVLAGELTVESLSLNETRV
jgi:UDP-glucose 4-epimerase